MTHPTKKKSSFPPNFRTVSGESHVYWNITTFTTGGRDSDIVAERWVGEVKKNDTNLASGFDVMWFFQQ